VKKGDVFSLGAASCEVLLAKGDADNDGSVVLRVSYGKNVFLFTGDASAAAEGALLYLYSAEHLKCDFLKVGHHGSNTASTEPFLRTVQPLFAAISCGVDNVHSLPHADTLERLSSVGAIVDRTDQSGTLVYMSDGTEVRRIEN
jgi:competence protein ComEC